MPPRTGSHISEGIPDTNTDLPCHSLCLRGLPFPSEAAPNKSVVLPCDRFHIFEDRSPNNFLRPTIIFYAMCFSESYSSGYPSLDQLHIFTFYLEYNGQIETQHVPWDLIICFWHTLARFFCSAAQFWSRMQEEARVGWSLTSIPAERLRRPTPLCSMLGKTIFLKVNFHREALSTTQRKCPIQFTSLFPGSLTLEFTALKSWRLNQTFLLLNSNYSGYYWFKVQHIMIAILISMLVSFIVLCLYW